jgi:hypothetical protein
MRLFRQTRSDDWNGVFVQVKEELIDNFGLRLPAGKAGIAEENTL